MDELHAARGRQRKRASPDDLTPMERRVGMLALDGLKVRQIADHLSVSPRTVESHLQKVYQKLHVSSQVELMKAGLPVERSALD